ncbi:MAG: thioredoxin family protein [Chlorobiaceae bacterium]|nr:thioredoxin family protein [Chlorobiaceae bacterium]
MILFLFIAGCTDSKGQGSQKQSPGPSAASELPKVGQKVTFVELGSLNCMPCRQMQPIMQAVEKKYGVQLKVVFYDIWNPKQSQYAAKYGIRVIPTQVFLDSTGKEFFRHEGFLSEEQIDVLLKQQGLASLSGKQR